MILVTGGVGFIGSHTCVELLQAGYKVAVVDNLVNSKREVLDKVKEITGKSVAFYPVDINDEGALREVFRRHDFSCVIHFAGLKAVGESGEKPLLYYRNNIAGTLTLVSVMKEFHVNSLVFSSSATVYGDFNTVPFKEDMKTGATNPYGWTKQMQEQILTDIAKAKPDMRVALLRYFNPIGAHESGLIGENPNGIPNNLVPYICRVAVGQLPYLNVFGNDYDTPDGTGVRDYIHVVDLARGHLAAMKYLEEHTGVLTVNLGTGKGYSVLEVVDAYRKASGRDIPVKFAPRRQGDIASCYADCTRARELLHWQAQYGIERMCVDAWRFTENNM
ncbi:MAG: UDP-glucose 4-epimerase GalE [Clostridia bacterium]|nr:UDP-glucose 4-epimerase GalE [Clostridia bacterium]